VIAWALKLAWIVLRGFWVTLQTWRQVEVIVCFLGGGIYMPALLCGRLLGKKLVYFEPSGAIIVEEFLYGEQWWGKYWLWFRWQIRQLDRRVAHVLLVESLYDIEQARLRPFRCKVRLATLYVDTDFYRPTQPIERRPHLVGFVGRLSASKGLVELLDAVDLLRDVGPSLRLVGDGPLRPLVEQALKRPELSHVEFAGWADDREIVRHLNDFRLLLLPTVGEGVSNVALEAMACGTPVLAPAVGGMQALIEHELTGFILPDRSPQTIARSLQEALAHPGLAEISQRGRQRVVENYSLAAAIKRWRAVLAELGENSNDD